MKRRSLLLAAPALILPRKAEAIWSKLSTFSPVAATCPFGTGLGDGCSGAPPGTPQFPNLLILNSAATQTYGQVLVARPNWNVAGVDYHVGIDRNLYPTNASLTDYWPGFPTVNVTALEATLQTFVSAFDGVNIVLNSTNNQVIQGYDFSLHGGVTLNCRSDGPAPGTPVLVKNCNFATGSNSSTVSALFSTGQNTIDVTITQCEFDETGTGLGAGTTGTISGSASTWTITYNLLINAWAEAFVIDAGDFGSSPLNCTIKYNVIRNAGVGFVPSGGAIHGDWIQFGINPAGNIFNSAVVNYNTWIQDISGGGCQCVTWAPEGQDNSQEYTNNVSVCSPNSNVPYAFLGYDLTWQISSTVSTNYIANLNGGATSNFVGGGPFSGSITISGNIDMFTGNVIT